MELSPGLKRLAAKSDSSDSKNSGLWLPLWIHSLDTAEIMKKLVLKWLPEAEANAMCNDFSKEDLIKLAVFLGLIHDIGKATLIFQSRIGPQIDEQSQYLEEEGLPLKALSGFLNPDKTPHTLAGEAILCEMNCKKTVAEIIGSHHGKPSEKVFDSETDRSVYRENYDGTDEIAAIKWKAVRKELLEASLKYAGYSSVEELPELGMKNQVLLTGLLIMADWIASNTYYFPLIASDETDVKMHKERVKQAWNKLCLPDIWTSDLFSMSSDQFKEIFEFFPNEIQKATLDVVIDKTDQPGIIILEAQMGCGKTEASLAAAEVLSGRIGCGGLFFGLPTQATANAIFGRLEPWAKKQSENAVLSIRLAHGMAAMNDDYQELFQGISTVGNDLSQSEGLIAHSWFKGRKQSLLANFVIGTVDQLLMSALKQKYVMLRHLGLAGKVVIVDECHAYDAYMNCYLDVALRWLGVYKVPVIILSATLPSQRRAELIDAYLNKKNNDFQSVNNNSWRENRSYPLLTWTDGESV